jgi:valyl-tRNA synthetase
MGGELSKVYNPQEIEEKWVRIWEEKKYSESYVDYSKKPFVIVIPPPNVTGSLHMGHALNNTLQDIIIRYWRMKGCNALWVPGTDHGGIATQNVVEKFLWNEKKITRQQLGREQFLQYMWEWKNKYGDTILYQLRRLGCSCAWERTRFTMDDVCSKAVIKCFVELYRAGLIYRGKRIVNWCPRCQTALSDIEVEYKERESHLWYIRYPFKDMPGEYIVVATTRPETMLGDTAVAVNPHDERYNAFIKKDVILPLVNRVIPVICDNRVDKDFGTGAVKVTPAHDTVDFEIGIEHNLPQIMVIGTEGKMTRDAGERYYGLDRYECRKRVIEDLKASGLLEKVEPYTHSVGHCYRCGTDIEFLISDQWFLKTKDMAQQAIDVVKRGIVKFYPKSWEKPYYEWLENLRDWCISRQIWWGHRIPVYYCKEMKSAKCKSHNGIIVEESPPSQCPYCGSKEIVQDADVLDTWFSSALWPFSVFGWAEKETNERYKKELEYYYPTSVLVTGYEILYLWVARMIMMGLTFDPKDSNKIEEKIPFREVYIHGIIRDIYGKKMSKSLGNVIDPLDIIKECGADALRFSLALSATAGRDLQLSEDSFTMGHNFTNKIWNAARLILNNIDEDFTPIDIRTIRDSFDIPTKWILHNLNTLIQDVEIAMKNYNLPKYINEVYHAFWDKFCSWYLEISKINFYLQEETISDEIREKKNISLNLCIYILTSFMKLLHPVMPFITEEIFHKLKERNAVAEEAESIMISEMPTFDPCFVFPEVEDKMRVLFSVIGSIRNMRAELEIPVREKLDVTLDVYGEEWVVEFIVSHKEIIKRLTNTEEISVGRNVKKAKNAVSGVAEAVNVYLHLGEKADINKEKEILLRKIEKTAAVIEKYKAKLNDKNFLTYAPRSEVERVQKEYNVNLEKHEMLRNLLNSLN